MLCDNKPEIPTAPHPLLLIRSDQEDPVVSPPLLDPTLPTDIRLYETVHYEFYEKKTYTRFATINTADTRTSCRFNGYTPGSNYASLPSDSSLSVLEHPILPSITFYTTLLTTSHILRRRPITTLKIVHRIIAP
jgi:hypothetical protein